MSIRDDFKDDDIGEDLLGVEQEEGYFQLGGNHSQETRKVALGFLFFLVLLFGIGLGIGLSSIIWSDEEKPDIRKTYIPSVPKTVPLRSDNIVLKVIQSGIVSPLDIPANLSSLPLDEQQEIQQQLQNNINENLDHVMTFFDQACSEDPKPDIVLFHEFPFTGFFYGDRTAKLAASIQIPGPQSDRMRDKAVECGCYAVFGSYVSDPVNWPGHILSMTTLVTPEGDVHPTWKAKNIKRSQFMPGMELTTTTIEGVYDRYVEMYGEDQVFPIFRTNVGNLALSSVQFDPMVYQTYATLGAEIFLRTATLFSMADVKYQTEYNNVYSAMANIPFPGMPGGGHSVVMDPDGDTLAIIDSSDEEGIATAVIPLKEFRETTQTWPTGRNIPSISHDMCAKVFNGYLQEIPLGYLDLSEDELFSRSNDDFEMYEEFNSISRWLN